LQPEAAASGAVASKVRGRAPDLRMMDRCPSSQAPAEGKRNPRMLLYGADFSLREFPGNLGCATRVWAVAI